MFMKIDLIKFETKKLITLPALWIFVTACLILNAFLIYTSPLDPSINILSKELENSGQKMTQGIDRFEGYETSEIAQGLTKTLKLQGVLKEGMSLKYEKLQEVVDTYAKQDVSLDTYAGVYTRTLHKRLFNTILKTLTAEGILFSVLVTLFLIGYEPLHKTDLQVYCTKVGRSIMGYKHLAAILCTVSFWGILCLSTLLIYFLRWDYSGFWSANVCSQNNSLIEMMMLRPFITWQNFTVGTYLIVMLMACTVLVLLFLLLGRFLGLVIENHYIAFLILVFIIAGTFFLTFFLLEKGFVWGYFGLSFSLPILYHTMILWFTDMGSYTLIPYHETITLCFNLVLLLIFNKFAVEHFKRKDI